MVKAKVCPVSAAEILNFLMKELLNREFFRYRDSTALRRLAGEAASVLPEDYFPDTYLDMDLTGGESPVLAFRLDSRECNLVNDRTEGRYFAQSGVPAPLAPEQCARAALMAFTEDKRLPLEIDDTVISVREALYPDAVPETEHPAARALLARLADCPVTAEVRRRGEMCTVAFDTGRRSPKHRFSKKEYADTLLSLLAELGAPKEPLYRLKSLSCNFGLPFYDAKYGYMEWVCCVDVAYFSVTFRGRDAVGFHVGIVLSDKGVEYRGKSIKPSQAYQWHITDNCDQRCKHCYLFGEDARLKCVTTPWDMLLRTLDECTLDAARQHAEPMLAVTGGDPILHPRFWDLAEEIHRRGIHRRL